MIQYLIIEIQNRADGVNNVQSIVSRNSLASGLSYFYDRCSKMAATELYPTVTIMLIDTNGTIIKNERIKTAWVEPEVTGE